MLTIEVALDNTAYHFDKLYEYSVPYGLADNVFPGMRVIVPFGKSNAKRQGLILKVNSESFQTKLKSVTEILDETPLIGEDLIKLIFWLKDRTFCTYFDAFRCILPTGIGMKLNYCFGANPSFENNAEILSCDEREIYFSLLKTCRFIEKTKLLDMFGFKADSLILDKMYKKGALIRNVDAQRNVADKMQVLYRLSVEKEELNKLGTSLSKKQGLVCDFLDANSTATLKEICYFTGVTSAVIKTLEKKNIVEQVEFEVYRRPEEIKKTKSVSELILNSEQNAAFESLCEQMSGFDKKVSLLYGITGSGKTQVYIKLIEYALNKGKDAILLVPEIALTPQIINKFCSYFGDTVAVFHSGLSLGERTDEWKRINRGEARVVIGTRSAVFAPVKNLGLIIIDEEQEHTYKSEKSPRYNAKEVARFRCEEYNALLLLGSATPSVETFARAKNGIYTLNKLQSRYAGATLPDVIKVDMAYEADKTISLQLAAALKDTLDNKKQAILLMNRRGYNTFVACQACKKVVSCPNCSISLTYHHANSRLMCHYCGYSQPMTQTCSECGKNELRYSGFGTQMIEDDLAQLFPGARILRMDQDTTMRKNSHSKALTAFAEGEYDILLGTQMVAKGIDFENVTLVGVISVDQQLYNDDFRSLERTFSLLTQVVGRAGRGSNKGKAIIQTLTPENEIIVQASAQDYDSFFDTEIFTRKIMTYPPYCDLCVIGFSGEDENKVRVVSKLFFSKFKELTATEYINEKVIVLGPMQPRVSKISNKFRYRMIIKCKNSSGFRKLISSLLTEFGKDTKFSDVSIFADINPESIL